MHPREIERELPKFEGLIFTTATLIVARVELDLDDICQRLRFKVWKSLRDYRRDKSRRSRRTDDERLRSWVFSCLTDEKKDILKKRRDDWLYIEDEAPMREGHAEGSPRDTFEGRYMRVEDFTDAIEGSTMTLPSTLDEGERQVILLLYAGRSRAEAAEILGLPKREVEARVKRTREKLADWRPSPSDSPPPVLVVLAALSGTPCSGAPELRPAGLPAGRSPHHLAA